MTQTDKRPSLVDLLRGDIRTMTPALLPRFDALLPAEQDYMAQVVLEHLVPAMIAAAEMTPEAWEQANQFAKVALAAFQTNTGKEPPMPTPASTDNALARYLDAWMNGGETTGDGHWWPAAHTWGPIRVTWETDGQRWTRSCTQPDCDAMQTRIGWPEKLSEPFLTPIEPEAQP
jgi:hypothetical protein